MEAYFRESFGHVPEVMCTAAGAVHVYTSVVEDPEEFELNHMIWGKVEQVGVLEVGEKYVLFRSAYGRMNITKEDLDGFSLREKKVVIAVANEQPEERKPLSIHSCVRRSGIFVFKQQGIDALNLYRLKKNTPC